MKQNISNTAMAEVHKLIYSKSQRLSDINYFGLMCNNIHDFLL